jgi:hypothetical protein
VDTDTEIRADVRHVFEDADFDIAVAERTGTLTEDELHKGEGRFMAKFGPHNKGGRVLALVSVLGRRGGLAARTRASPSSTGWAIRRR